MAQTFKWLCLATSLFLLLQLTNAGKDNKETDAPAKKDSGKNKKSVVDKSEKDDEKAPFLQNIESINKSKPVEVAKDVTKVVVKALGSFKDDFVDELNQKSKAQKNGPNSIVPNMIQNNVVHPTVAAVNVGIKKITHMFGNLMPEFKPKQVDKDDKPEK